MRVRTAGSVALAAALCLIGGSVTTQQIQEAPASAGPPTQAAPPPRDPYQRSTDLYLMQSSAKTGPQHGEDIYYFKCFFCHSPFAKAGSAGPRGPLLKGIFTRPTLRRDSRSTIRLWAT